MKKLFASILCLAMVFGLTACGGDEPTEFEVAMITDSGSVTDKSFNQSAYEAVKEFGDKNNLTYKYYAPKGTDEAGLIETIDDAVDNGAKVIVTPGFNFTGAVTKAQDKYPDVKFITIDFAPDKKVSNTVSFLFTEAESGYAAGYAAVKEGYTKLGFMGGMALPAVINYGVGYVQGASDAAKELGVEVEMKYTYTGTFVEDPKILTQANAWYKDGTEIIFSCGGQICNSIFKAAEDNKAKTIGVDSDQDDESTTVVCSALKDVKGATLVGLEAYKSGDWKSGCTTLANCGSITYKDGRFNNFKAADNDALTQLIADGKVQLKSSADVKKDGNPADCKFPNVKVNFQ